MGTPPKTGGLSYMDWSETRENHVEGAADFIVQFGKVGYMCPFEQRRRDRGHLSRVECVRGTLDRKDGLEPPDGLWPSGH